MHRMNRVPSSRRGAAAIEFALCAPVLFMLIFAIVEFSRATQLQQTVRQAAFEGARAGVALDASTADVNSAIAANLAAVGVADPSVTVTPSPLSYTSPTITVSVSTKPATNGWFLRFFNDSSVITSTITLRREVQAVSVLASVDPNADSTGGSTTSGSASTGSTSSGTTSSGTASSGTTSGSTSSGTTSGSTSSGSTSSGGGWWGSWGSWGGGGWW